LNLSLLKLHIVELLDKHHKITTVAELLGLKQPTVTFHMKNLEREFGVKLFDTRMGKIILTDAGHALLHYAVKINALAAEAQRVVGEFDTLQRGSIRIGASYVPATYVLPAVLHGKDSSTRQMTDKWLEHGGRRLPSYLELDSLEAIKQAVMLGEHVSFVSRIAVQSEVERGLLVVRPIPGQRVERYVYMVSNKDRHRSALIRRFAEYLSWSQE
jgi:DNA-binding transcriptional LysR family regulator